MTDFSVSKEAFVFLCSALSGAAIFFIYDLFRLVRKKSGTCTFFVHIQDGVFWLIALFVMFFVVLFVNNGILRLYELSGALLGAILYGFSLSEHILKLLEKNCGFIFANFQIFFKNSLDTALFYV